MISNRQSLDCLFNKSYRQILFLQQLVYINKKENIKAPPCFVRGIYHWPVDALQVASDVECIFMSWPHYCGVINKEHVHMKF